MKSGEHFDVIIIGAGPSGIFCAYELIKEKPELNILMIEKGIIKDAKTICLIYKYLLWKENN